jgi:hypothetical protein
VGCCDVRVAGNGPASSNNYAVRIERQANEHENGAVPMPAEVDHAPHGAFGHKTSFDNAIEPRFISESNEERGGDAPIFILI